ncbi:MAG TPA: hypothetical protein VLE48_02955 [Terriglobales bacterium]|nr:hypothetical protein [Terriglobales bacterium]
MNPKQDRPYSKLVTALIAAWFAVSLSASALGVFRTSSSASVYSPLPLGLAVLAPIVLFTLWWSSSAGFRQFALSLNPRTLTVVQAWRIGGFVFLILHAHHILPGVFALPAGWGDIAVGATAPLISIYLANAAHRKSFVAWQVLGMLDLALAVTLGVLASPTPIGILADGLTTDAMSVLPLSLIPTFAVPLLAIFHIICIAQAARWPEEQTLHVRHQAQKV